MTIDNNAAHGKSNRALGVAHESLHLKCTMVWMVYRRWKAPYNVLNMLRSSELN
jgi:hypothetical protein